jgi:hypothetical protein
MADIKEPQKEKTSNQRSNRFSEEFSLQIGQLKDFYCVVGILNCELGHGNWTTVGRPVRKLRRYDYFNRVSFTPMRTIDIIFRVPAGFDLIVTRLMLALTR